MSQRNSVICIAKEINMDRNYKNTLALSQDEIQALCQRKAVYMGSDYSFIRTENRIKVQAPFSQIFPGNYCYIINQGVRQFFFVLDVKYVSDATTEIKVEEDVLTTYKDKGFNFAYCERQHPQTDEMYANTVTEPITPSNYRKNGPPVYLDANPTHIAAAFTELYNPSTGAFETSQPIYSDIAKQMNGIPWKYYEISQEGIDEFTEYFGHYVSAGKMDSLVDILYVVNDFRPLSNPVRVTLPEPEGIQYHEPKNKKLYNYPYTFVQFSNCNGSVLQLKPELLESREFLMTLVNNSAIGQQSYAFPLNYMGRMYNYDYSLMINNYPHSTITADSYTAWLGAAARNFREGLVGKLVSAGLSVALAPVTGGFSLAGAGAAAGSIVTDLTSIATHTDDTPDTVKGQSSGDIVSQMLQKFTFRIENMSLPREQAEVVDDFFTRFGYAQSNTMPINTTNPRFHCHYVKTAPGECVIQGIPQEKADIINAAFNNGITFWDSNDQYGNYDLKSANTR